MKRHHQILAGLLVIQIVLSVVVFWPKPAATEGGEAVFPELATDDIVALSITDDTGNTIALHKDAGEWVLPNAGDYPAMADKITPVLDKLLELDTDRLVTRTDASHKRLQVAEDDFVRRIEMETADGEIHVLYLGSAPRYTATHFRLEGQNETYLSNALSTWELNATAGSWIDTNYYSADKATLSEVVLENANGSFTFVPAEGENWTLEGLESDEEILQGTVNTVINKATNIVMLRPLGTEMEESYGLDDPVAVVTLKAEDDSTVTVEIGAQDPEDTSYVVKVSASPYYVRVAEFNVSPLLENTREDFIKPPATPEDEESSP